MLKRVVIYRTRDHSLLELSASDRLSNSHLGGRIPFLPSSEIYPLVKLPDKLPRVLGNDEGNVVLALPTPETEDFAILTLPRGGAGEMHSVAPEFFAGSHMWYLFVCVALLSTVVAFIFHLTRVAVGKKGKLNKQSEDKVQAMMPRKKKSRKSLINKNSSGTDSIETSLKNVSRETMIGDSNGLKENLHVLRAERKSQLSSLSPVESSMDGRKIGKLFVSNKEIAKGSNGTIVLEGTCDGRPVAVKRLVQTHHDVAWKEIQNLIASDCHPNIVQWYGVEYDQDFVYLCLERCMFSLGDLIFSYSSSSINRKVHKDQDPCYFNDCTIRLHSAMEQNKDYKLWKSNGHPSGQLLKLMRDIVSGLAHLHELGIVHRDLKPQNVLIINERSMCAKLSDMGISKRLHENMSSLTRNATDYGSSGWQAPEQLHHRRQTRAVDLFSLGCLLFFCLTGGQHPFGESFERDVNIVNNKKDLFLLENFPEAMDLISHLLDPDPDLRTKAVDVLHQPLFWNAEMRLSFLRDASDRVELEDSESESELLKALESIAPVALGGKWDEKMESAFISDIGRYRRYKFDSVRDLLRVICNKLNHFRELSP